MTMSKSEQFTDNFSKAIEVISENCWNWLHVWIFIYARDPNERSEKFPDWQIHLKSFFYWNDYDKAVLKEMIQEYFSNISW